MRNHLRRRLAEARTEAGVVLVYLSVVLIGLLAMAAFAVDIASWYREKNEMQRAAEAASLAGVVWMPGNVERATATALQTARRNGYVNGEKNVTITVQAVPGYKHRLRVVIERKSIPTVFAGLFVGRPTFTGKATAEYTLPVAMGSPENIFGTGNLDMGTGTKLNYWAAVNGYCTPKEAGDRRLAIFDGVAFNGFSYTACTSTEVNSEYDAEGYVYDVELKTPSAQNVEVQVYDPGYNPTTNDPLTCPPENPCIDEPQNYTEQTFITTRFDATAPDDTPYVFSDDPPVPGMPKTFGNGASRNAWAPLFTIPAGTVGRYRIKVSTQAGQAKSWGANNFGLRAVFQGSTTVCSTATSSPRYRADCPQVFGEGAMSIFANQPSTDLTASFYLTQIGTEHAGKRLVIQMWDPGESQKHYWPDPPGACSVVVESCGSWEKMKWGSSEEEPYYPANVPSAQYLDAIENGKLLVSGTGTQPGTNPRKSDAIFNDRLMYLRIAIPDNYVAEEDGWWKIIIEKGSGDRIQDRTTWSVDIVGDPVHLVDDEDVPATTTTTVVEDPCVEDPGSCFGPPPPAD